MMESMNYLHQFLAKGDYLIVEDGFLAGAGLDMVGARNGGPPRAIAEFLHARKGEYDIDTKLCDFFGRNMTANTNGYLKRL